MTVKVYAYVRSKQRNKVEVGPLKDSLGHEIIDNKDTAELLNNYFSRVFTLENTNCIPTPEQIFKGDQIEEGLNKIEVTEQIVLKKLCELNINKCPGPDELHPKLLFELRNELH